MTFAIGQRWVSQTEPQLGLGIITEISSRQLTVVFPAADDRRTYAHLNSPLSRITYQVGDQLTAMDDQVHTVLDVVENGNLMRYLCQNEAGEQRWLEEVHISCFIQLISPQQRICSGQFDKLAAYDLRVATLHHQHRLQQSSVRGLIGSRTSHLPHQVYIASEVARRFAPRVLLADEVGLGKTIEAGMILHYQLHTARARRVLIVVPDSLVHQWLVEMLRRFNLHFSIFDRSRMESMEEEGGNPFESEQLVLCSLSFLTSDEQTLSHAINAGWDMMVVDEAHHLHWTPEQAGDEYLAIEKLSQASQGLLLLTATPEQVGIESHFARLRLLDPSRFFDLEAFKAEEQGYQQLNEVMQSLLALIAEPGATSEVSLDADMSTVLLSYLPEDAALLKPGAVLEAADVKRLVARLLDRHGTGRVQYRNTRSAIKGFPARVLHPYPLALPEEYKQSDEQSLKQRLYPETCVDEEIWLRQDPRVDWLKSLLKTLRPEKVLVICANAASAIALEQKFRLYDGLPTAAFHEGLTLVERDRAAAYFAEAETGAQVLICSEIGSEGRNFQFAHHMVIFDLPLNPDLLEQRIGRLDRIGQKHDINIHVPYLQGSAQEVLFRWYQEGLNLFESSCAAGFAIYEKFESALHEALQIEVGSAVDTPAFTSLVTDTRQLRDQMMLAQQEGRDRLLEMHSCDAEKAKELIALIEHEEEGSMLELYMENVWEQFGVDHDYHSRNATVLMPTDHMLTGHFPGLQEDGTTVTFSRVQGLSRDDMAFLSWEHPMVVESMDMVVNSELGNATLASISVKALPAGTLLLEAIYTVNSQAPAELQLERFLPASPVRVLVDINGKDLSAAVPYDRLNQLCEKIKRPTAQALLKQVIPEINKMIAHTDQHAGVQLPALVASGKAAMVQGLGDEIARLKALMQVNPSIREEELTYLQNQQSQSAEYIDRAALQLQAVRLVVNAG